MHQQNFVRPFLLICIVGILALTPATHAFLGYLAESRGWASLAISEYSRALGADPHNKTALGGARRVLRQLAIEGDFEVAASAFQDATPESPARDLAIGLAACDVGKPEYALALFRRGLESRPEAPEYVLGEATALYCKGLYSAAAVNYATLLEFEDTLAYQATCGLVLCMIAAGDLYNARVNLSEAFSKWPCDDTLLSYEAMLQEHVLRAAMQSRTIGCGSADCANE